MVIVADVNIESQLVASSAVWATVQGDNVGHLRISASNTLDVTLDVYLDQVVYVTNDVKIDVAQRMELGKV